MISRRRIRRLYDHYLELVQLEVEEFGVEPTEVRHLIGRLGEFYCALHVKGSLARAVNQPGFDVVSNDGRLISVKTTAQKTGFIPISAATINLVDDLMVIQYAAGNLEIIYYGCIAPVKKVSRYYEQVGRYNLDIAKARKLATGQC